MNTLIFVAVGAVIVVGILFLFAKSSRRSESIKKDQKKQSGKDWPEIEVTLDEVVKAVREFSLNLPKGVSRTILVKDDYSIDFEQLASILQGIPSKPFYMSRETYDIFEEADKEIPPVLDKIQKAVDLYVKDNKQYPCLSYDPLRRVNYFELIQGGYLQEEPKIQLYITEYDGLVSHHKPKTKGARN